MMAVVPPATLAAGRARGLLRLVRPIDARPPSTCHPPSCARAFVGGLEGGQEQEQAAAVAEAGMSWQR